MDELFCCCGDHGAEGRRWNSIKQSMRAHVYGLLLLEVAFIEVDPAPARPSPHASNVLDTSMHSRVDAHPLVHLLRPPARGIAMSGNLKTKAKVGPAACGLDVRCDSLSCHGSTSFANTPSGLQGGNDVGGGRRRSLHHWGCLL